jgi:hypothetical protein
MEFTLVFTSYGTAIYIEPFNPGLSYLDEARAKLGPQIMDIAPTDHVARDCEVKINEETARRMGELFAHRREAYVHVSHGFLNQYVVANYERVDETSARLTFNEIDKERLIEHFIQAGCPENWDNMDD